VGPPAVARVPRAVPLFPLSYLYSGGMECDFNEAREVLRRDFDVGGEFNK